MFREGSDQLLKWDADYLAEPIPYGSQSKEPVSVLYNESIYKSGCMNLFINQNVLSSYILDNVFAVGRN